MNMHRISFVVALVLVGCATSPEVAPQGSSLTDLVLEVEATPLTLKWGESIHIQLTVKNTNDVAVVKEFSSGCIYGFSLWTADGELVAPPPRVCTLNAPIVTYGPNTVVEQEFQWVWDDKDIKPGTYRLVAGFGSRGVGNSSPAIEIRLE